MILTEKELQRRTELKISTYNSCIGILKVTTLSPISSTTLRTTPLVLNKTKKKNKDSALNSVFLSISKLEQPPYLPSSTPTSTLWINLYKIYIEVIFEYCPSVASYK